MLLDCGDRAGIGFAVGRDVNGLDLIKHKTPLLAPGQELPEGAAVGQPPIAVADVGGKELDEAAPGGRTGIRDHGRKNDVAGAGDESWQRIGSLCIDVLLNFERHVSAFQIDGEVDRLITGIAVGALFTTAVSQLVIRNRARRIDHIVIALEAQDNRFLILGPSGPDAFGEYVGDIRHEENTERICRIGALIKHA